MLKDTMYSLSPLDGRYIEIEEDLAPYFSEYALVKNRVRIEIKWLCYLMKSINNEILKKYNEDKNINIINDIYNNFDEESFNQIREIEKKTKHDVKAVEYYIDNKLEEIGLGELKSFVHFGCTSEDINNTAEAFMIKEGLNNVWIQKANKLIEKIEEFAKENSNIAMLAHTHGQPATPTTVGKELYVFVNRLKKSLINIKNIDIEAKFNGATGTFGALNIAFPNENIIQLCKEFVEKELGFKYNLVTTQIESHDYICHILDGIRHFNNIMLDFDLDMWNYIFIEYFKQKVVKDEVGSSVMPHKVNPICFENSEGNIDMSNAICMTLSNKLPKSRMQRDLSDSSSKRNIGLAIGYSLKAIQQTIKGLEKVEVNKEKIREDLKDRWEVIAEPIQTLLRKYGVSDAYERLKELTRGKEITEEIMKAFIKSLDMISEEDKVNLLNLTPENYIGLANEIVKRTL